MDSSDANKFEVFVLLVTAVNCEGCEGSMLSLKVIILDDLMGFGEVFSSLEILADWLDEVQDDSRQLGALFLEPPKDQDSGSGWRPKHYVAGDMWRRSGVIRKKG